MSVFSKRLNEEEKQALLTISELPELKGLELPASTLVRYAILFTARMATNPIATKEDLYSLRELIMVLGARTGKGAEVIKPPRANAKSTEDEKNEKQIGLCTALSGRVDGKSCAYTKYEVTATGRPVDYSVTMPLDSLTEQDVLTQYDPNKYEYELKKKEWSDPNPPR